MKKLKIREEFVREAYNSACSTWKQKIENEFPELFKKELEYGRWLKDDSYPDWMGFQVDENNIYGFGSDNKWFEFNISVDQTKDKRKRYATAEEVETALVAEAKKRGFKEGVTISSEGINDWKIGKFNPFSGSFSYKESLNVLECANGNGHIFDNGKWAEIVVDTELDQMKQQLKDLQQKIEEYEKRN